MPLHEKGRPGKAANSTTTTADSLRHDAALRLPPLECGHRDPLDCIVEPYGPSSFGLGPDELRAEVARCAAQGWQGWELAHRFVDPRTVLEAV